MAKRKYQKKAFESIGTNSDTSANIYHSMLISEAWQALSKTQKLLYLYMKAQYYQQKQHPQNNPERFYFNKYLWCNKYGLYKNNNHFAKDRDALIEKGLIKVVEDGSTTRTKNVYQFSSMWQKYDTVDFRLEYSDMSTSLARKKRKEQMVNL